MHRSRQIVIAGAGIAGLTAAIAFASKGFAVRLYEQSPELEEAGAGLQLSPNATRLLASLGVLDVLRPAAVRPERIVLRGARSGRVIAAIPLGSSAEGRWRAPYLVVHRADLQSALLDRAAREHDIRPVKGARVSGGALDALGATVSIDRGGGIGEAVDGLLLVGADGVRSRLRRLGGGTTDERPSGYVAWRATIERDGSVGQALSEVMPQDVVTVFLDPRFHLVSYPIRAGAALNLVAITEGEHGADRAIGGADIGPLSAAMRGARGPIASLPQYAGPWTRWPISEVDQRISWTGEHMALIGDAAHAMTPFAAQGAAMAIEDAVTLAELVAARPDDIAGALGAYEAIRRRRVQQIAARGRFNHFAWHARWPVSLARDVVLRLHEPRLAADFDWIYGYDARKAAAEVAEGKR